MLAFPLEEDTPQSRFSFKLAFDIFPKLMSDYIKALRVILEDVPSRLRQITFDRAEVRPAPGKWSPKEVIGHLIDSASNNHQRFVRAQFQDNLIFLGYAQDDWVRVQDYQSADWAELIQLWEQYNFHLARVMERVPAEVRFREHRKHNLHQIAWKTIPEDEPATLDYFMRDYVGHLAHHIRQLLPTWQSPLK